MQLWRFIKCMFGLTVLALIYIHMQMNIFSLAYTGKQKEQHITQLKEQNTRVEANIFELKSASYIGRKLLNKGVELKFCDGQSVVQLPGVKTSAGETQLAASQTGTTNPFSKLLAWRFPREAQAKEQKSMKPWDETISKR